MKREPNSRTRDNPLHLDLFERSSQSLSSSASSSTLDMALNDEGNVRRRLSDYARPVLQRPVTRIHAPLARNANFRIDSHVMSILPIFHGKTFEDPYRHVDELSQVCDINLIHNVSVDVMKMKLFPTTLRDRAKDLFLKLGKEFTSWTEMEEEFLKKYYSVGKTTSVRKVMREFTQGPSETFHEAWERLRDLTKECPHHGVSNHELTQIFYDGLGPQDRYLLDAASGGTFMSKFEDEAMELIETVVENNHHNTAKPFGRGATPKGVLIGAKSVETGMLLEKIDKMAEVHNLLLDRFHIRNGSEGLAPVSLQEASHAPIAHVSTTSRWIVRSWQFKGRAYIDKAHREGKVNRDDRAIKVHIQLILITLFIIILYSNNNKDLGGTLIRCILHIAPVSNKTRNSNPMQMQDSRRISHHSNRTIKLHDRPHHLQILFWV